MLRGGPAPARRRDEKLNLTDMWRAAGGDEAKRPYEWARLPSTEVFADHIAAITGKSRNELFQTLRGGPEPATYAHWQMGMAYAKYLSPAFHAWCNEVVRDHMEGNLRTSPSQGLTAADLIAAFDAFGRGFRGEVSATVSDAVAPIHHRLDTVESGLAELRTDVTSGLALLREHASNRRKSFSEETKRELLRAAHEAGGKKRPKLLRRISGPT